MKSTRSTRDRSGSSPREAEILTKARALYIRKSFLCAAAFFCSLIAVQAQSRLTLAWDRNSETNIAGYKLYQGTVTRVYTNVLNVGNATTALVSNLVPGITYRFAVTAYDMAGAESEYSSEIAFTTTNGVTPNIPPTLAGLANLTMAEDSGARTVFLTGISSGGENQTLTVTASATPQSLIPSIETVYVSPGTTGTVSFVTAPNSWGTGVVNVTVSDGLAQTVRSFTVTVNPVNDAPTLTSIANSAIVEDTATPPIPFTIGDAETSAANLTLAGASSDLVLVPNANIVFGGSGASRTVRITPAANQFGTASINVSVSDGSLSATRTFQLTVASSNDAPTIAALPAATVPLNIPTVLQPVVIADIDTAASSLVVTGTSSDTNVLPDANIVLGALGLSRTLSVHPLQAGTATVTVRVSDGVAQSAQSFLLTVTNIVTTNMPPTLAPIANVTVNEDSGLRVVSLTGISAGANENQALSVSVSATPSSLIPTPQVSYISPSATGAVSFVTGTNMSGSGTVTVTVSDGAAETVRSFTVMVNPVNDAPTLTSIANSAIVEDTATPPIPFTIGDAETSAANLTLAGASSDLVLVPNANIVFGGSGASRTVRITPAANQFGTASINVSVSDGSLSATRTFQLTVASSNDAPTIAALPAATVPLNIPTVLQPVVIADIDTAASSLVVTGTSSDTNVLPDANIVLGTLGLSRTLSVHPLQAGTATVTVRVSDGVAQSAQSFLLTVTNIVTTNMPPTLAPIANVTVNEDSGLRVVSLTGISAGANENQALSVSVSATPSSLIPTPQVSYISPSATGAVSFVTGTNMSGSGTVTVTVSDGAAETVRSFTVTVNPVNDPPGLTSLGSRRIIENTTTGPIPFTIGDVETPASNLALSGTSSNPTLVPQGNIAFGGSSSNRTVQVTPATGQLGTAAITVWVSDGALAGSRTFELTVTETNHAPTMAPLANASVPVKTVSVLSPIEIGDVDSTNLIVTGSSSSTGVLPNGSIFIGTSGLSRTLSVRPQRVGTTTVTLTVSDGFAQSSQSFLLTVTNRFKLRPSDVATSSSGAFTISWESSPGDTYRVMANSDLISTNWVDVSGNLTAVNETTWWIDNTAAGRPARFYVIEFVPSE